MIKATVASTDIRNMQGVGKTSGKPYNMFIQTVYYHLFDKTGKPLPFPEKSEVILEIDESTGKPRIYPVGSYELHPSSIYLDRFGNLSVSPKLFPVKA